MLIYESTVRLPDGSEEVAAMVAGEAFVLLDPFTENERWVKASEAPPITASNAPALRVVAFDPIARTVTLETL